MLTKLNFFSHAFDGLQSTRYLNLSHNNIAYKTSSHNSFFGVFKYLGELEQLDLSHNYISLKTVDEVMFDEEPILPCLRCITFHNNQLSRIERNFFYGLQESNLQELNFQNCELESIDPCKIIDMNTLSCKILIFRCIQVFV